MRRKVFITLISAFAALCCTNAQDTETINTKVILLDTINQLRAEGCMCGNTNAKAVGSLIWDKKLAVIAKNFADQLQDANESKNGNNIFLSHVGIDGSTLDSRLKDAGIASKTAVENIAFFNGNEDMIIDYWLNNPESCQNIMEKKMTAMGAARSGDFWVLILTQK